MVREKKSTKAELAVSTRAKIGRSLKAVSAGKVEDSEKLNVPAGCKLVPRSVLNAHLERAERDLRRRQTHPDNCVRYGVPEELARALSVAAARIPSKQQTLDEAELASLAAAETEAVRAAEGQLDPIIARARNKDLSLERLLAAVRREGSEKIGLNRFLSFSSSTTSIVDDGHIRRASAVPVPTLYDAEKRYQLKVMVKEFRPEKGEVKLVLGELPKECSLFSKKDVGRCGITVKSINAETDLVFLGLLASYKVPTVLELKLSCSIAAGKLAYTGALCTTVCHPSTVVALRRAMRTMTKELFAEQEPAE